MKRTILNSILAIGLFTMGIFVFQTATANAAGVVPATNCTYTGNSADECYASDGTNNYIVFNCRPGTTSCGFTPIDDIDDDIAD